MVLHIFHSTYILGHDATFERLTEEDSKETPFSVYVKNGYISSTRNTSYNTFKGANVSSSLVDFESNNSNEYLTDSYW